MGDGSRWFRYEYASYGAGHLLVGLGIMMVAIHKEMQMHAALDHYEANADGPPPKITVHASFVTLLSAAGGLILVAISEFNDIGRILLIDHELGVAGPDTTSSFAPSARCSSPSESSITSTTSPAGSGLWAVVIGIAASLGLVLRLRAPRLEPGTTTSRSLVGDAKWVAFGLAYLLAALAGALVLSASSNSNEAPRRPIDRLSIAVRTWASGPGVVCAECHNGVDCQEVPDADPIPAPRDRGRS